MANRVVVLVGPGVLPHADLMRVWATEHGLPVANTVTLKGLFRWDSPHHIGTVGLQERDFELAGFGEAERIYAVGVDEQETPRERWAIGGEVVELDPASLPAVVGAAAAIEPNRLFTELSAAVHTLYESEKDPPSPARVVADLAASRQPVVVRPGSLTAFWMARTFPSTDLGTVRFGDAPTVEWGEDDVDWEDTQSLIDVAGDIVAWGGVPFPA